VWLLEPRCPLTIIGPCTSVFVRYGGRRTGSASAGALIGVLILLFPWWLDTADRPPRGWELSIAAYSARLCAPH
jgi:hypothetical protein